MIHSCPLKCELQVRGLIFSSHLKVVLLTSCQCIFFSFLFCFSSQTSRFYKKKLLYSPLEEQAMTLNSLFIKRDRRKKSKSTRGTETVFSQMSPLYHFPCECEQVSHAFSVPGYVKAFSSLWVPGWSCLWNRARHCFTDETGVCLVCPRPVTHSRSPVWACAPHWPVGGRGRERVCTGSQPATWGPVHPTHKTWTSRNHDWCPLVCQTCSADSGTVQSWFRPHTCKGRLCSTSLPESEDETSQQPDLIPPFWCATVNKDHTAPLRWVGAVLFM